MSDGILKVDVFRGASAPLAGPTGTEELSARLNRFHEVATDCVVSQGGRIWRQDGDSIIACGFRDMDLAVFVGMQIQRRLSDVNEAFSSIEPPLILRIGISRGELPNSPDVNSSTLRDDRLNEAGHLEAECPPGRIRISQEVYRSLHDFRKLFRPSAAKINKELAVGSYVWVKRSLIPADALRIREFDPEIFDAYPMILESEKTYQSTPFKDTFAQIGDVLKDCVVIMGETTTRFNRKQEFPVGHPSSTSDAIGIIELMAAAASNSSLKAGIDEWLDTADLAVQQNIVVVGSPAVNLYAYAANMATLAGFDYRPDAPLRIRVMKDEKWQYFPSGVEHSDADKLLGLVLLTRNPLNPAHKMLWIAGVTGMATQCAARWVRDLMSNAGTANGYKDANVAIVRPRWRHPYTAKDYHGRLRVDEYVDPPVWWGRV